MRAPHRFLRRRRYDERLRSLAARLPETEKTHQRASTALANDTDGVGVLLP
jgi:hypothetical protein